MNNALLFSWGEQFRAGFSLTCDVDAVSRLHLVDQVVVRVDDGGVGCLTGRHVLWRLLDFDLWPNVSDKATDAVTSAVRRA